MNSKEDYNFSMTHDQMQCTIYDRLNYTSFTDVEMEKIIDGPHGMYSIDIFYKEKDVNIIVDIKTKKEIQHKPGSIIGDIIRQLKLYKNVFDNQHKLTRLYVVTDFFDFYADNRKIFMENNICLSYYPSFENDLLTNRLFHNHIKNDPGGTT